MTRELTAPKGCGPLCTCHFIEKECFSQALGNDTVTVATLFRAVGVFPKCGKCALALRSMIREHKEMTG